MISAAIAMAEGSPCPTAVLQAASAPAGDGALLAWLRRVRRWMCDHGLGDVLKFALVEPDGPGGLVYRFVQAVPGGRGEFELRGSCGHSILAAVLAAETLGWTGGDGAPVRVEVRNNGDIVHCETTERAPGHAVFTVRFTAPGAPELGSLAMLGDPVTAFDAADGPVAASGFDAGNPYVFIDASDLGIDSAAALFTAGDDLYRRMAAIRTAAERRLGWTPGTFPKIAAVLPVPGGALAARAISVPSWHPTLALTGVIALAAACALPGTIPFGLLGGRAPQRGLTVMTPGGTTRATADARGGRLHGVRIDNKEVRMLDLIDIPVPSGPARPLAALSGRERTR